MKANKKAVAFIIYIFVSLLFYVWQKTQNVRLGYEISSIQSQCDKITQENIGLELKISSFLSLEKLDALAKKKGLIVPNEKSIIYLDSK